MKRKANNPRVEYPRLRYTHEKLNFVFFFKNCLFDYENQFAVGKKHKKMIGGNFKNILKIFFRRHQKHASHTFSICGSCMISIF